MFDWQFARPGDFFAITLLAENVPQVVKKVHFPYVIEFPALVLGADMGSLTVLSDSDGL